MTFASRILKAARLRDREAVRPLDEILSIYGETEVEPVADPHPYLVAQNRERRTGLELGLVNLELVLAARRARAWRDSDPVQTRRLEEAAATMKEEIAELDREEGRSAFLKPFGPITTYSETGAFPTEEEGS